MLDAILDFTRDWVVDYGYAAVFLLMLLGSACIPIPSEAVMLLGGALASGGFAADALDDPSKQLGLAIVVVVGVAGSLAGSWLAYWAGYAGGRPLIDRWGRYLLLRPHEVDRAHAWFERHGQAAVFFVRLIPLMRAFISLPAGVARMDFVRFSAYSFLGILPWTLGLALGGYWLGERWTVVEDVLRPLALVVGALLLVALVWWVARRLRDRRSRGRGASSSARRPGSTWR